MGLTVPASMRSGASTASGVSESVASVSPVPSPSVYPPTAEAQASVASEASPTPISNRRGSDAQTSGNVNISSDITAWRSALQSLPPEFAKSELPNHPLTQLLAEQPTLRPVEWNQYRQQGGFLPRTSHDYSALMIYLSGQVNPNPCRNCLLRNGPFAQCVVAPPTILAISSLRHACANCTYQCQYKKCTNDPITELEKARSELSKPFRGMARTKPLIPRKPKTNARTQQQQHHEKQARRLERPLEQLSARQRQKQVRLQLLKDREKRRHQERRPEELSLTQLSASVSLGLSTNLESFDEKLRHIRACSPRTRRRMAAETLQWQAAIATVEAEGLPSNPTAAAIPIPTAPAPAPARAPYSNQTPVPSFSASLAAFASPATLMSPAPTNGPARYGANPTFEPMEEDESESEEDEEGDYNVSMIKTER